MNKNLIKVLIAFIAGQAVQLICHGVALNLWEYRQIPFCLAGGFLVLVAVFAGAWVATHSAEPEKPKSYLDYAEEFNEQ